MTHFTDSEIRSRYVACFQGLGLTAEEFEAANSAELESRELPLREPNPANYPSLKEILGEERASALELEDPGPDFSDPSFWGQAMKLRGGTKSAHDQKEDWELDRKASTWLHAAGFPVGSESRMNDADGNKVWSLDQDFEEPEFLLDLNTSDPGDVPSAEEVVQVFKAEAQLTNREAQLAYWLAENGAGAGWTPIAAEALGLSVENVRKMFQRLKAKAPDFFQVPDYEPKAPKPRPEKTAQELLDADWSYEPSLTPDGYPFDDQV
ncbi:helix-turn-helix transcriptional regulator [Amycolatopsis sp. NPDC051903]|uniref:helix-turn-helix transcriptional regulator n=1 Tax=Amycolatopsis sp. NPDC051903 TaxID=3363936 RepID=UPI0037A33D9A